tara:strand:- start:2625 stop:3170 length:546 start_codon:yes stop_codon:yes gene_type:complete
MEFKNTIQALQKLGGNVIKEGRGILKNFKPHSKIASGALYNQFDYLVTSGKDNVTLEFEFGKAEDYWQFVDEGVRGAEPSKHKGRPRAAKSPFKYSTKMPPRGIIDRWIVKRGLKAARENGKFISRKGLAFAIQRSIFERGLQRTQFFTRPFTTQLKKQEKKILEAFANDLETELKKTFKD